VRIIVLDCFAHGVAVLRIMCSIFRHITCIYTCIYIYIYSTFTYINIYIDSIGFFCAWCGCFAYYVQYCSTYNMYIYMYIYMYI